MVLVFVVVACSQQFDKKTSGKKETLTDTKTEQVKKTDVKSNSTALIEPLVENAKSNITDGSVKYGATIVLGELDKLGRPTFAHIRVTDAQEPGQNGEKRNEKINVDPAGWKNYKLDGSWVNDRTHLVGYQFSGLNDEKRNLITASAYLNRGTSGKGADAKNEDGMLYYEQQLDNWLRLHPNYSLDYYVAPMYDGDNKIATSVYMQWVGIDKNGQQIAINIGGKSKLVTETISSVVLDNVLPNYKLNYATGEYTKK